MTDNISDSEGDFNADMIEFVPVTEHTILTIKDAKYLPVCDTHVMVRLVPLMYKVINAQQEQIIQLQERPIRDEELIESVNKLVVQVNSVESVLEQKANRLHRLFMDELSNTYTKVLELKAELVEQFKKFQEQLEKTTSDAEYVHTLKNSLKDAFSTSIENIEPELDIEDDKKPMKRANSLKSLAQMMKKDRKRIAKLSTDNKKFEKRISSLEATLSGKSKKATKKVKK
jgi:hypothetical protein